MKSARQHADHGTPRGVELNAAADDVRIGAEARLPEVVTDHHDRRRTLPQIVGCDQAPHRRLHAQRLEQFRRGAEPGDAHRLVPFEQRALHPAIRRQRLHRLLALLEIDEIADADEFLGDAGGHIAMLQDDELVGATDRQRAQQHRFDDREQRGVGANSERQRQHRGGGESRLHPKQPQRAAHILDEHSEGLDGGG